MSGLGATPDLNGVRDDGDEATLAIIECCEKIRTALAVHPRLEQLPNEHPLSRELQTCVMVYVDAIRRLETSPESALVQVKRLIHEHLHVDALARRAVADDAVRWAILAYFPRHPNE